MGHHHGTLDQLREPTKSLRRAVPDTWGAFVALHDQGSAEGVTLGVRPVVRATLAADHRASDGHDGGRFLAAVDRLLQKPETPKPCSADFFAATKPTSIPWTSSTSSLPCTTRPASTCQSTTTTRAWAPAMTSSLRDCATEEPVMTGRVGRSLHDRCRQKPAAITIENDSERPWRRRQRRR